MNESLQDESNGYEAAARQFMASRNPQIGTHTVREWSRGIARGSTILDLGCGHGMPISQVLIDEGFDMYGVDASPTLTAAFRERFPNPTPSALLLKTLNFSGVRLTEWLQWD